MSDSEPQCGEITDEYLASIEMPWWLTDECHGSDEAEYASWLGTLPADIQADYEAGPWTGAGESIAAGFLHHDRDGRHGDGFAAGGYFDALAPGLELAAATASNADTGHEKLGESELIGVLCAWQRLTSWAQAGQAAAAIALASRRNAQSRELDNPHLAEHVPDEVAAALRLTSLGARRLLMVTAGLKRLPALLGALRAGRLDWPKVCVFTDLLDELSVDLAKAIVDALLGRAGMMTTGQLRAALTRAVLAADPAAAERRKKAARKDASVQFWYEMSGNAVLSGRELAVTDALHANLRLSAFARWLRTHGATDTMDQLRAAVYIALLTGQPVDSLLPAGDGGPGLASANGAANNARAPDGGGADSAASGEVAHGFAGLSGWPAVSGTMDQAARSQTGSAAPQVTGTINLTMPLSTWIGLSDVPGELAGHGPLDAVSSRDLAGAADANTRWCLTLTGQDGRAVAHACARHGPAPPAGLSWAAGLTKKLQFLETGACSHRREVSGYRPSPSLRHLIQVRQRTCSGPGCRRAAVRCDLDHTIPYDQGGRTCECDLAPACRHHHRAKQAPNWGLTQDQPGVMTWQLPHGRTYQTMPEPYPV